MSGEVGHRKRLITVTGGNLRNNHMYFSGHHDFFDPSSYGGSSKKKIASSTLTLQVDGLRDPVITDIAGTGCNGKSRNFFRKRGWVRKFFEKHEIKEGDIIAIERLGDFRYRIYPFENKNERDGAVISTDWSPPDPSKPAVVDLFAGCGGFSFGLKKCGFENLLAVEWDSACCETFRANINSRILQCAIQEVDSFPQCDLLVGGPPCQGFSNLGERLPNDPRRQLWRHFLRALTDSQPAIFIMENVPPILKSGEFREICKKAQELNYRVEGRVLNSADYGVPQQRKRAFIIGSRIGDPIFPQPTHRNPQQHPTFENHALPFWKTVRDAIGNLPAVPDEKNWHIGRNPTAKSLKRYKCVPEGGNRFNLPEDLKPECWKRKTKGGTDLFGRLWWDRPSVTIRTEFYKPEKGRYLHPIENRPITHREAARLQGFEDGFEFIGKKIEVGIEIGNAVPPPLAYQIGLTMFKEIKNPSRNLKTGT